MSQTTIIDLVIGVVVLALLIVRQLSTRRLRENFRLPLILAVVGIVELAGYLRGHPASSGSRIALALGGSLVLAAATGAGRALTIRVWQDGGQLLIRGSWLTGVLWVIALAAHLGYDELIAGGGSGGANLGNATVVLYLMVTLTIQRVLLLERARRQGLMPPPVGAGPLGPAG